MTYFLKSGDTFRVSKNEAMDLHEKLPAGNYVIKEDPFKNLYLERIEDFVPVKRIYGDCIKNTDRIINTFMNRPAATGVMLTGEKGSGKTLLTKNVAIKLAEQEIPTIIINQPWCGDKFNTFIQSIEQPCAVLFDEFEKTYDRDEQEQILTLLDGVFPTKKLFMITCNDKYRVDIHMRNRPGRIYYMLDFKGLDAAFVREYCDDNLNSKSHIDGVVSISGLFNEFNFDMLKALVEEMNRYNEPAQESIRMLNAKPEFDRGSKYDIKIYHNGVEVKEGTKEFEGNPLHTEGVEIWFDLEPENDETDGLYKTFDSSALIKVDAKLGEFVFADQTTRVVLTRIKKPIFSYFDAF